MLELKAYWLPRTRVRLTLLPREVPSRVTVHAVLPTFPPRMYVSAPRQQQVNRASRARQKSVAPRLVRHRSSQSRFHVTNASQQPCHQCQSATMSPNASQQPCHQCQSATMSPMTASQQPCHQCQSATMSPIPVSNHVTNASQQRPLFQQEAFGSSSSVTTAVGGGFDFVLLAHY